MAQNEGSINGVHVYIHTYGYTHTHISSASAKCLKKSNNDKIHIKYILDSVFKYRETENNSYYALSLIKSLKNDNTFPGVIYSVWDFPILNLLYPTFITSTKVSHVAKSNSHLHTETRVCASDLTHSG